MSGRHPTAIAGLLAVVAMAAAAFAAWRWGPTEPVRAQPSPSGAVTPTADPGSKVPIALDPLHASTVMSDVAERAVLSVVNISTTRIQRRALSQDERLFRRFWGLRGGDHDETQSHSLGSGVIVDPSGVVVTNNHVIEGAHFIHVRLADGRDLGAEVVGADPRSDLAVLRLQGDASGLVALPLADSDRLRLGEMVLAIGSPFGLGQSVSHGIVSAKGRANVHIADYEDFVQTDAAINPGNSGGALINLRGELVGINTAIASSTGGSEGIGFAIPTNMLKPIMQSLLEKGRVVRGWLGVGVQDLSPELRQAFQAGPKGGLLVTDVQMGSPAAKAGVRRGDVMVRLGATPTDSPQRMRNAVAQAGAGAAVEVELLREGKSLVVQATLAEAPDPRARAQAGKTAGSDLVGLRVAPMTAESQRTFELPAGLTGVVVAEVEDDSVAARAGLQRGDVILEIDRRPVTAPSDLVTALQAGRMSTLLVWRDGRASFVALQP